MRILTTLILSAAFTAGITTAATACSYDRSAKKKQTIAEAPVEKPTAAVSTFQPVEPDQLKRKVEADKAE